jgi:spore coat protein CotH
MRSLALVVLLVIGCGNDPEEGSPEVRSNPGPDPFAEGALTTYAITMAPADWDAIVADPNDNTWRRATLAWEGESWADVAVRPSGQNSRIAGNPKPSLHLDFEEFVSGRHFHHLPSLKLDSQVDDPALLRERLTYSIHRTFGLAAPREVHARLVVNGAYKGLYTAEERVTKAFVKDHFGAAVNQLYKWTGAAADFFWIDARPDSYVPGVLEPHIGSLPDDAPGILGLFDALNHAPYEEASGVFDVDAFMRFLAIEVATGEMDSYLGSSLPPDPTVWSNNFYVYKVPATGKYLLIAWDRNEDYWRPASDPPTATFDRRVLTRRFILEPPGNRERFLAILKNLLEGPGATDTVQTRIDSFAGQIADAMMLEPLNPASRTPMDRQGFQAWQEEVRDLRNYVKLRNDALKQNLP